MDRKSMPLVFFLLFMGNDDTHGTHDTHDTHVIHPALSGNQHNPYFLNLLIRLLMFFMSSSSRSEASLNCCSVKVYLPFSSS